MRNQIIDAAAISAILVAVMFSWGCSANWFSATTESCYTAGEMQLCFKSSKNQENFKAKVNFYPDQTVQSLDVQTTATTAESAIAAASQSLAAMADVLNKLIPLLEKAALSGS